MKIVESVKRNAKVIGKVVATSVGTIVASAAELAAFVEITNRICDGVDDDHPASVGQVFGTCLAATAYSLVGSATIAGGAVMVGAQLEDWEDSDE